MDTAQVQYWNDGEIDDIRYLEVPNEPRDCSPTLAYGKCQRSPDLHHPYYSSAELALVAEIGRASCRERVWR